MQKLPATKTALSFEEWATGFSGIPGGNLQSNLWFCGIEYGGFDEEPVFELPEEDQQSYNGVPCWDDKTEILAKTPHTRLQYDYKCAKIACVYHGLSLSDYKDYFLHKLFCHDGDTFKMNLYPMAFPSTDNRHWTAQFQKKTGFENKKEYLEWCAQHRFPHLKSLVQQYEPETLICTGTRYAREFERAFIDDAEKDFYFEYHHQEPSLTKATKFTAYKFGKTQVAITPFLGPGGLMADLQLQNVAQTLKERKMK